MRTLTACRKPGGGGMEWTGEVREGLRLRRGHEARRRRVEATLTSTHSGLRRYSILALMHSVNLLSRLSYDKDSP